MEVRFEYLDAWMKLNVRSLQLAAWALALEVNCFGRSIDCRL